MEPAWQGITPLRGSVPPPCQAPPLFIGVQMKSISSEERIPGDVRWTRRDICVQRGAVPAMQRGEEAWVWFSGDWRKCIVKRRLPGGVYAAELRPVVVGCSSIVICANNYGGYVE